MRISEKLEKVREYENTMGARIPTEDSFTCAAESDG